MLLAAHFQTVSVTFHNRQSNIHTPLHSWLGIYENLLSALLSRYIYLCHFVTVNVTLIMSSKRDCQQFCTVILISKGYCITLLPLMASFSLCLHVKPLFSIDLWWFLTTCQMDFRQACPHLKVTLHCNCRLFATTVVGNTCLTINPEVLDFILDHTHQQFKLNKMQRFRVRREIKQNTLASTCKVKQKNNLHAHKPKQWQKKKTSTVLSHCHATTIHNAFIVQSDPPPMDIIQSDADWARFYWHNLAMTSGTMCNKLTFCCQTGITHYFQKAFNHFHCITPYPKLDQYYIYIYMYIKRDLQVMFLFHQNFPSLQWWLHSNKHVHTYVYVLTVNKRQTSNILPTSRTMFRLPLRWRFFLLRRDTWSAVCYETCIFNFSPHMNSIFTW